MRDVQTLVDRSGTIAVHHATRLFDSGHDFPLLQAFKKIEYGRHRGLP